MKASSARTPNAVLGLSSQTTSEGGALAGLALSTLLASLGTSIANVALPALAQAFGASFAQVQWVVLAYLLAITTLGLSVGRLGDLLGRKRLLGAGIVVFALGSAASGLATGLGGLIAARAVQGLGAAVMMTLSLALISDTVAKERMGRAMGLIGTMSAVGTALGPSLGGILIAGVGWRSIFLVTVPFSAVAFGIAARNLAPDRIGSSGERKPFDMFGTLLLAGTLAAYALATTSGRESFGLLTGGLLLAAAAGGSLFVWVQRRARSPLIQLAVLRDAVLRSGLITNALVATVMMATLIVGPFYLAGALKLEASAVGLAMAVGPIVAALSGIPAGHLVDRFGAHRMVLAGLSIMAAGAFLFVLTPVQLGVAGYVGPMLVLTPGYALLQAANNTGVMSGVLAAQRGVIAGVLSLARNLGLITGASVMGTVFSIASRTSGMAIASPDAIATGLHMTFGLSAALLMLARVAAGRAGTASRSR